MRELTTSRGFRLLDDWSRRGPAETARGLALVLGALTLLAGPAQAHNIPCAHTHSPLPTSQFNTCNTGATCTGGTCVTISPTLRPALKLCQCNTGGCMAAGGQTFITSGVPGPSDTRLYSTEPDELNESLIWAGSGLLAYFGSDLVALDGTILLTYGDSDDFQNNPTNVTVTVDEVILSFPSLSLLGLQTGEHFVSLSGIGTQTMSYDSTTGVLSPGPGGILVDIANNLGKHTQVPVYFEATIDLDPLGDGPAQLYGQLTTDLPGGFEGLLFLNGFESGDTSYWTAGVPASAFGVASLLLAGGIGVMRKRRHRADEVETSSEA